MARIYATTADLAAYPGGAAVSATDAPSLLVMASRLLDSAVFRLCWYSADATTGMPTDSRVTDAFRDAVCAQAVWWDDLGDSSGALGAGYGSVSIGTARLQRSGKDGVVASDGTDSPARQVAPAVWDVLLSPDLPPSVLYLGMAVT